MRLLLFYTTFLFATAATAENSYKSHLGEDDTICVTNTQSAEIRAVSRLELNKWVLDY